VLTRRLALAVAPIAVVVMLFAVQTISALQNQTAATGIISGNVKSPTGTPMEGVGVSARNRNQTYTTTVYTDRNGNYVFPALDAGPYRLWAQTVGFDAAWADQQLGGGGNLQQNFSLKTTTEVAAQLSGSEWMASLPDTTPEDRRGKQIFSSQCTGCHTASWVLQSRFDEKGWGIIIDMMSVGGLDYSSTTPRNPMMQHYKKDLAAYLARVRGPRDMATPKPHPRPSGDATQVVITEYDMPRPDKPNYLQVHNGSDWSEGTPSRFEGRGPHDVAIDKDGMVWIADDTIPDRTLAKLDPRNGRVTEYKLPDLKDGTAVSTHSVVVDERSNTVWATNGNDGEFISLDPMTGTFKRWPRPETVALRVGGTLTVDLQGNPWAPAGDGAIKLDISTGRYSEYPAPTKGKGTYGIATDARSNVWYTQPGGDRVVKVDTKTGDSTEVIVGPRDLPFITQFDRDAYSTLRANQNVGTPQMKAPRRGAGDLNGNYVWFAEFSANQLLRLDIRDNSFKEYPLPTPHSNPYAANVDKNHQVWLNMISTDRVARFDPGTEKFTEYFLPTRGTEIRHIGIDNRPASPDIWICYDRPGKIARLQLRPTPASATR
jgi:streptogramin lyase